MPELPEVEVTRLSFASRIAGARIESVRLGKALRWPLGCEPALLLGRTVRLLAQLTRQVALVQYPLLSKSRIRHVELVPLSASRAGPPSVRRVARGDS